MARTRAQLARRVLQAEPEGIGVGHGAVSPEEFTEGPFEACPWIFLMTLD